MKIIDKEHPGTLYCDLECSHLKQNPKHPGMTFLGIAPEYLTSVMIECHTIGWQTMTVKWLRTVSE